MSPRIKICKEEDCQDQATTKGFCRYHYLLNWSKSRRNKKKAAEHLNTYVERLVEKNPDGYLNEISKDIQHWEDGATIGPQEDTGLFEDFSNEDSLDHLIDNLKVDDDY